jgi:hypothetical protein
MTLAMRVRGAQHVVEGITAPEPEQLDLDGVAGGVGHSLRLEQ